MVLVPKGFLGGDIRAVRPVGLAKGKVWEGVKWVWVLELRLKLFDVHVEGFFFLLVKLLMSGMDEVVKGYLDKVVTKGGLWQGLEDKVGKRSKVVLEGSSGLGDIVLIDSVEHGGPGDRGR